MNYIQKLQQENANLKTALELAGDDINSFLTFLQTSPKFQSTETERKDWISTGDVIRRLREIRNILPWLN